MSKIITPSTDIIAPGQASEKIIPMILLEDVISRVEMELQQADKENRRPWKAEIQKIESGKDVSYLFDHLKLEQNDKLMVKIDPCVAVSKFVVRNGEGNEEVYYQINIDSSVGGHVSGQLRYVTSETIFNLAQKMYNQYSVTEPTNTSKVVLN